ncbi:hypothetical protein HII31_09735 [Pseudocercospora fuligena]|uniref:Uncharacterized protein n=1 Tax=Pseudocercospora fuligena TaxID=685502 RepID=A0A8H6RE48_9PEZI|nr:hypothetical protein HII31_09735 [Pseudocercospora fuligena]
MPVVSPPPPGRRIRERLLYQPWLLDDQRRLRQQHDSRQARNKEVRMKLSELARRFSANVTTSGNAKVNSKTPSGATFAGPTSRSGPSTSRTVPASEPNAAATKANKEFSDMVSEFLQSEDPELKAMKNAQRIAGTLKNVQLSEIIQPVATDKTEQPLRDMLSQNAVPGRDVQPKARSKKTSEWTFTFTLDTGKVEKSLEISVPFTALADNSPPSDQQKLHGELARLYNTWPWELKALTKATKHQLLLVAMSNLWARPMEIDEVTHKNTLSYGGVAHYINSKTGALESLKIPGIATATNLSDVNVPTLPAFNVRKGNAIVRSDSNNPYHTKTPVLTKALGKQQSTSKELQHRAEDAVYWLALQLQGLVATPERMTELFVMYRKQIGLPKPSSTKAGLYGGTADLYSISQRKDKSLTLIAPTKKIADDLGLTRSGLSLYVHSLNASRATPVMETVVQTFCGGVDIRYSWIEAAKMADVVNMEIADGAAPSSRCDCDEEMAASEMHPCEGCTDPTLCKTRSYDSLGRLVCPKCRARDQANHRGDREPGESIAAFLAYQSLWINFQRECSHLGVDPRESKYKAVFDSAWKQIKARLPGQGETKNLTSETATTYVDEWTNLSHDIGEERPLIGSNPSRRRVIPHGITIDTIRRQGAPSNFGIKHSGNNNAITSNACQMAKGSFNPGVLHEIGEFKRLPADEQASEGALKNLVEVTTAMAVANCKRPYINAGTGSKDEKYQKILAESVAGRVTPGESGPWEKVALQYVQRPPRAYKPGGNNLMDEETWKASQKCAKSMEDFFGVTLYDLKDGTKWIGATSLRMRGKCNKKWQTKDNNEKLYREILFQFCCSRTTKPELQDLKDKYGDRLGLPLVVFNHSPLRLSFAHRTHGSGMSTGWTSDNATDVQERIDNDESNNMLIETWYVNAAKLDMAEDYYEELDTILCAANITDKNIYNPGQVPAATPNVTPAKEVKASDEFEGIQFDSAPPADGDKAAEATDPEKESTAVGGLGASQSHGAEGDIKNVPDEGVDPGVVEMLNQGVESVYGEIFRYDGLKTQMQFDADLRRLLAELQGLADDGNQEEFDVCIGQVYERYINQAQQAQWQS